MAKVPLILAQPDSSCGKVFHTDRRAADEHRIVLEVWNRATGRKLDGYRLAVFQCTRCGGFHVGRKRANQSEARMDELSQRVLQMALQQEALGYVGDHDPLEEYELDDESEPLSMEPSATPMAKPLVTDYHLEHYARIASIAQ
jgi:hypothetical protein